MPVGRQATTQSNADLSLISPGEVIVIENHRTCHWNRKTSSPEWKTESLMHFFNKTWFQDMQTYWIIHMAIHVHVLRKTSTGIDADASKGETSPGYFNSKLVHSYKCGTICPWEFPEISLAYSHILLKGPSKPSRPIIYGKIFWPPHIASPASICHRNQLSFVFRLSFHLTIHFENAGNICNKYDL